MKKQAAVLGEVRREGNGPMGGKRCKCLKATAAGQWRGQVGAL